MEKKKLVIINNLYEGGGVEKLLQQFIDEWADRYDVRVVLNTFENIEKFRKGVTYYRIKPKFNSTYSRREMFRIANVSCDAGNWSYRRTIPALHRYDALLCMKDGPLQKYASFFKANKKVAMIHDDYTCHHHASGAFTKGIKGGELRCMQQFDSVVCVSEKVKRGVLETVGDPGNLLVRYNPIDIDAIRIKAESDDVSLPEKNPDKVRFVMVGAICNQKGYDILLDALEILDGAGYSEKYEVIIAGDLDESRYIGRTEALFDNPSVRRLGFMDNPFPLIAGADWFLSTSKWEGFSLSAQEAVALGVPVMLTDCAGVDELIGDSEFGIRMKIDARDVAVHMMRVIDNPDLNEHYRTKSGERIPLLGSYKERIREMEKLLGLV